jgi:excisionase family DNA binding protein
MDKSEKAPNIVPKGAIRLSEAFEVFYRSKTPDWKDISDRCAQWDEQSCHLQPDEMEEDPYPLAIVATDRAESLFRSALYDGVLRAYIHNARTGIDLELDKRGWRRTGEETGINSDYSDPQMPGPDAAIDGVRHPIFLLRTEFEIWMSGLSHGDNAGETMTTVQMQQTDRGPVLATRAFSLEDVIERTGLSKTKLYEEIDQGKLRARKSGTRTLILETDLDAFLNGLQRA